MKTIEIHPQHLFHVGTETNPTWEQQVNAYLDVNPPSNDIISEVTSRLMNVHTLRNAIRREVERFLAKNINNIYVLPNRFKNEKEEQI